MPHPRYTQANRKASGAGYNRQLQQNVIDFIHEMAEVDGTDSDIISAVAVKFDGLKVSVGSVHKYAKDARDALHGDAREIYRTIDTAKRVRVTELFHLGYPMKKIKRVMNEEKVTISYDFIRRHLKAVKLIPQVDKRWINRKSKPFNVVEPKEEAGEVEEKVQPEVREHPSMEEVTVEVVSLDELLQGFNVNQEVNDIKVTNELETMEMVQVTMVQVYQDALSQIDNVIRPSIVKGLEAALQLQATDSILEELKFLRSAMEIPNSILESQRTDQETTIQQVANSQSQAVMKALYQEQQAKRDVELQRQAYANANAGEGSLNQRD